MMFNEKGQSSMELVTIAAVAITVIVIFFIISQGQVADIGRTNAQTQAKGALEDISGAAKEVYTQGIGAKKKVFVTMPSGVDPVTTSVSNKSIRLNVNGDDYVRTEEFEVHGTLPTGEGGHYVWVISEGNKVRIGYAMVDLSRQVLLVTMQENETKQKSFDLTNIWSSDIDVALSDSWSETEATFGLDSYSANGLAPGSSKTFTATFTTTKEAVGIYTSELVISADDGAGSQETITMPVILQVVPDPNARPPLIAVPPVFNETLNRSQTAARPFQICTNEYTSVSYVNFTVSSGDPGDWVGNAGQLGPIAADTCVEKYLSVTPSNDSAEGNHTGNILLTTDVEDATDSIGLQIEVGPGGDLEGPIVRNITTSEWRVHIYEPTTILAVADDNETGGSRIKGCQISTDGSAPEQMFPVDGDFNSSIENVSYTYFSGFGFGRHTVEINCTDWPGNTGNTSNYSFVIGKHILFVLASGNESDWSDWITVHYSGEGYAWDYDTATIDEVISGAVNMTYYDAVIFIDWSSNEDFVNLVNEYKDMGGWLGLFGDSAHQAVRDLNYTWHPDNAHPENSVNILNNSHYVTDGFPTGLLTISSVGAKVYSIWGDPENTSELGSSGWFYPSTERVLLAEVDDTMFWGPMDPWALNENGVLISTRVIDYMINQSLNR